MSIIFQAPITLIIEDFFKYRLNRLISLANDTLYFDCSVELGDNIKINTDIYTQWLFKDI